jgi:hypothetical protein
VNFLLSLFLHSHCFLSLPCTYFTFWTECINIFLQGQSKRMSSLYLYNNGNELSIKCLIKGIDRRVL